MAAPVRHAPAVPATAGKLLWSDDFRRGGEALRLFLLPQRQPHLLIPDDSEENDARLSLRVGAPYARSEFMLS